MKNFLFLNIGGPEIILILILIVLSLPLFCILDIIRSKFQTPNANILWIIVVLVAPVIGSILYLTWGRSQKVTF